MTPTTLRSPATLAALSAAAALTPGLLAQDNQRQLERSVRAAESNTFIPRIDTGLTLWERSSLDVGGTFNMTAAWLDDSTGNARRILSPELLAYARANIDGAHSFYVRARANYRDFSEGDSFDGRGDTWVEPMVDRYWYEFDLRRAYDTYQHQAISANINVRVGRQFVDWATGLALSETLYCVRPTLEIDPRNRFEGLFGITPDHTIDFDSSRATYDRKTRRMYTGAMFTHTFEGGTDLFAHFLAMKDKNNDSAARVPAPPGAINFNRDSYYIGIGARGFISDNWLYLTEGVYQTGHSASDPIAGPQTVDTLSAWAGRFQLTYVFRDALQSRAQIEFLIGSGDADRGSSTDTVGGNLPNTTDHGYNSLGFSYTGLAFSPTLSNLMSARAGGATHPWRDIEQFKEVQIGGDVIGSWKYNKNGGIDEATNTGSYLGTELDLYANWRVTSDFALTGRAGVFWASNTIAGAQQPRYFFLVGGTLSF